MRARRVMLLLFGVPLSAIVGCAVYRQFYPYRLPADAIGRTVGAYYGERSPHVVAVEPGQAENGDEPVYSISMVGTFHTGQTVFRCLHIGAMADRMDVWYTGGYIQQGACRQQGSTAEPLVLDAGVFAHVGL